MSLLNILLRDKILKKCPPDIKSVLPVHYMTRKLAMLLCSSIHIQVFDKNFERLCVIRMFLNFERKFECSNLIRMFMYEIRKVQIQKNSGKSGDRQV